MASDASSPPEGDDPSRSALLLPEPSFAVRTTEQSGDEPASRRVSPPGVRAAVWAAAGVAGLLAALAGAEPTGSPLLDAVWSVAFAVVVTLAASRASRATGLWMAAVAAVAAIGGIALLPAAVALALSLVASVRELRHRALAATGGALAVTALLRLPDIGPHGVPSLIAAVAVVPVLWSGYTHSPRRIRRLVRRIVIGLALALTLAVVLFGVASVAAGGSIADGVEGARAGADLVRDGENDAAADRLVRADRDFDSASSALGGLLTVPARAVPVLAQHVEALSTAADEGGRLASTAADAASTAPYQELKASDGQVDLVQVERMQAPVAALDDALQQADAAVAGAQSPWLVRPVADGLADLEEEIGSIAPEAALADEALQVAPSMLGADGPRLYLVLFTSPAESRFLGGFTASYGVLSAVDGKVDLIVDGKVSDLATSSDHRERTIEGQDEFVTRYGRLSPERYFQNLTASPDMATTAEVSASLFEQTTGTSVDGVIVVDPFGLAALLELTGPIEIPDRESPLTSSNTARYLLLDQYLEEDDRTERKERLEDVGRETFDALTSRELPGPRTLGEVMGPVVREKRLMFHPFDADALALMDDMGASGSFERSEGADLLSFRTSNAEANKLDTFLDRTVTYDATYDARTGDVRATATVVLTNRAPATGLPDYVAGTGEDLPRGTTRLYTSLYSPLQVVSATLDGEEIGLEAQDELGVTAYSTLVQIPARGSVTLVYELEGAIAEDGYQLDSLPQPAAGWSDEVIHIRGAEGAPSVADAPTGTVSRGVAAFERPWRADAEHAVDLAE